MKNAYLYVGFPQISFIYLYFSHEPLSSVITMVSSAIIFTPPTPFTYRVRTTKPLHPNPIYLTSLRSPRQSHLFPPFSQPRFPALLSFAYVSGPASDPIITESDPKVDDSNSKPQQPSPSVLTWELLLRLLMKHKLRLALAALTLIGCATCTLSMPIFSGEVNFPCLVA